MKAPTSSQKSYTSLASIQASAASSQLIDILLTNVWPLSITQFSAAPLPDLELSALGAAPLSDVIRKTKPRYHFAAAGGIPPKFWEREPYVWDDEQGRVARFVSLGAFGGEPTAGKKQRECGACLIPSMRVGHLPLLCAVVLRVHRRTAVGDDGAPSAPGKCDEESVRRGGATDA